MTSTLSTESLEPKAKVRDRAHDIAKGLGILSVVQVHIFNSPVWYKYILMLTTVWLMSFFFTLSGYYYESGARKPGKALRRRAVQLLKPYLEYSFGVWVIASAYNLIKHSYTLWECVRQYLIFLFSRNTFVILGLEPKVLQYKPVPNSISFSSSVIPFWFVFTMFVGYIIFYYVVDYALSNYKRFISITSLLVILTYLLNLGVDKMGFGLPWNIQNAPVAAALMLCGAMFGKHKLLSKGTISGKWQAVNAFVAALVILGLQIMYNGTGSLSYGIFSYFGAIETFSCMIMGIMAPFMAIAFARLLDKIPVISSALAWVGVRTIPFLFTHLIISSLLAELFDIKRSSHATMGESLLNLLLTITILVIYRIVWEFILKKIHEKKKTKVK